MHPLQWLGRRDPDHLALRRAGRAAIVMPAMFALGEEVIANPALATFAAFGSFAMLLLVDFGGPVLDRLRAQAALAVAGCALVCLGTLVSQSVWLAAATMAVVGFVVIFAGVVSSVLVGATTSLLLAFILPATIAGGVSSVPDRVAGWALAAAASLIAVGLLWPAPTRGPLRSAATAACRALAARMRTEVAYMLSARAIICARSQWAVAQANGAVAVLHRGFLATPYRPTSLSTAARTIVRLVDELNWLNTIVVQSTRPLEGAPVNHAACAVKAAAATVLERGADLLEVTGGNCDALHGALVELTDAMSRMEESATADLPVRRAPAASSPDAVEEQVSEFITSLDPSFRAQELGFAVSLIGANIDLTAAAERRSWLERLLGRQPEGLAGTLSAAQARATAHVDRHSVWLHNSVRGAVGLGLAVFVANRTGVQHSFWVVLGTLSVLRSNALNTGQSVVRALLGTVAGFIIGAAMLAVIGTNTTLLWFLLPPAILLAGVAPAAISFAAGQAAFTLTLVFLFNIIQPAGWRVGLLRLEDIAIGCSVSLAVGLLLGPVARGPRCAGRWPTRTPTARTTSPALSISRCFAATSAVRLPPRRPRMLRAQPRQPNDWMTRFAYLAERGAKPVPLAEVTSLLTGVTGVRLAADAVLDYGCARTAQPPATGPRPAKSFSR